MKIPFVLINIAVLLMSPLACLHKNIAYILAALSWAALAPYLIFVYKADPSTAIFFILIFNLLLAGIVKYRKNAEAEKARWGARLRQEEAEASGLAEKLSGLEKAESAIKESELAMVSLYEVTKKMSEDLRFNDIFEVFSAFLKGNFTFRKCGLFILNWDEDSPRLERRYSVRQEEDSSASEDGVNIERLIDLFVTSPQKLYFSRAEDGDIFERLEIKEGRVETYVAIPLVSDRKVVAILTAENLPRNDLERFIILSMQFALEIKKVLLYETVEKLATTDFLTGLYVRQYFSERLGEELQRSKRYKLKFAVLMIDIDDFKKTNDTYGHLVGDVILKSISHILREITREIDLVARYGGEEFTIGLPETGTEGARIVAERIRKKTEETVFKAYDEKLRITVSIGIAAYPKDSTRLKDLIEDADRAMYAAKKMGKNLVCEYKRRYNKDP